jgi:hypothetical protein
MTLSKDYLSAPVVAWSYEKPRFPGAKMMLLTVGCVLVTGTWYGEVGEYFLAWAPMPKRDKVKEREIAAVKVKPVANTR